jgi:hypothetical protein
LVLITGFFNIIFKLKKFIFLRINISSSSNRPLRNATSLELFPTQNDRRCLPATSPPTPNPSNNNNYYSTLWGAPATLERHANFQNLNTLPSSSNLLKQQRKSSSTTGTSLLRRFLKEYLLFLLVSTHLFFRNSSPSVALIRANSLHSSRDRISPQAIQELLEFSRLSGRMRRTASPDGGASSSHMSSRSASPSCMSRYFIYFLTFLLFFKFKWTCFTFILFITRWWTCYENVKKWYSFKWFIIIWWWNEKIK